MALMRRGAAARETRAMVAAERPARQAGRFRGPRNASDDEYLAAGAQVMDKLMTSDTRGHDLEWLSFDDLKKIYVFMTEAWFNSQWTRGALLTAVTSIASEKHPELLGGDSPRSERPPGSPANSLRSLWMWSPSSTTPMRNWRPAKRTYPCTIAPSRTNLCYSSVGVVN